VGSEQVGELLDQRHLADRGGCLRRHPPRRFAAMRAGELGTDPDQPGVKSTSSQISPRSSEIRRPLKSGGDQQAAAR